MNFYNKDEEDECDVYIISYDPNSRLTNYPHSNLIQNLGSLL